MLTSIVIVFKHLPCQTSNVWGLYATLTVTRSQAHGYLNPSPWFLATQGGEAQIPGKRPLCPFIPHTKLVLRNCQSRQATVPSVVNLKIVDRLLGNQAPAPVSPQDACVLRKDGSKVQTRAPWPAFSPGAKALMTPSWVRDNLHATYLLALGLRAEQGSLGIALGLRWTTVPSHCCLMTVNPGQLTEPAVGQFQHELTAQLVLNVEGGLWGRP